MLPATVRPARSVNTPVRRPPAAWFADPQLEKLTPLTVTADGRVFGHLVGDHVRAAVPGLEVASLRSSAGADRFHAETVRTSDGRRVSVGRVSAGRSPLTASGSPEAPVVVAQVRAYQDAHGVAVAGALAVPLPPEIAHALALADLDDPESRPLTVEDVHREAMALLRQIDGGEW